MRPPTAAPAADDASEAGRGSESDRRNPLSISLARQLNSSGLSEICTTALAGVGSMMQWPPSLHNSRHACARPGASTRSACNPLRPTGCDAQFARALVTPCPSGKLALSIFALSFVSERSELRSVNQPHAPATTRLLSEVRRSARRSRGRPCAPTQTGTACTRWWVSTCARSRACCGCDPFWPEDHTPWSRHAPVEG